MGDRLLSVEYELARSHLSEAPSISSIETEMPLSRRGDGALIEMEGVAFPLPFEAPRASAVSADYSSTIAMTKDMRGREQYYLGSLREGDSVAETLDDLVAAHILAERDVRRGHAVIQSGVVGGRARGEKQLAVEAAAVATVFEEANHDLSEVRQLCDAVELLEPLLATDSLATG